MKKHRQKILLLILIICLGYGIVVLTPIYKDKRAAEKAEEKAVEIMNVLNDPNLSTKERNAKLQELYGISPDGVGTNGNGIKYEFTDKSTTKEYIQLEEALKENDFTIVDCTNNGLYANYEDKITVEYINYGDKKEIMFSFIYDDITKVKLSKNKKFKNILKVVGINNLNIDSKIENLKDLNDRINLSLDNEWNLEVNKIEENDMIFISDGWENFGDSNSDDNNSSTSENMLFLTFEKIL